MKPRNRLFRYLLLFSTFLFLAACSSKTQPDESVEITPDEIPVEAITDTAGIVVDTSASVRTLEPETESTPLPPPSASGPGEANVAYSYFRNIKKGETKDIRVLIKTRTDAFALARQLRSMEQREKAELENNTDTNTIRTLSITGYETISVSLVYDTSDFQVTPVATRETQRLDTAQRGNNWHWRVKAVSDKAECRLLIVVVAENPANGLEEKDRREIAVNVEIDKTNALRRAWIWILENPEYSVPSIFVPVVIFVVGIIRRRRG